MRTFLRLLICAISIFMSDLPAAATECKSELIGFTTFFFSKGKQWSITWKADGVHKKEADFYGNLKEGLRTNIFSSWGDKRAESLPQSLLNPDKQFNVPFDISQNRELLIATIYEKSPPLIFSPQQLALVDLKKRKIIQITDTVYKIRSLAWAPDDKYFAVLYAQDVTKQVFKGPIDWLAEYLGHGNYYWTFYLTLYLPNGTSVCTAQVEEKLPNAMAYIDWEKQ